MAQRYPGELGSVFALAMNFQGDPEITSTTLNARGQCLRVPHSLAGHGDTERMESADTVQLCFEYKQMQLLKDYVFRRTSPAFQGEQSKKQKTCYFP